ncbi:MAG: response regulator, partial [Candidatus Omnitrophota bacterium]
GDGLWVLQKLKEQAKTMDIPVIILTASGDDKYIKKVTDLGIEAFMRKPYRGDKLVGTINNILEKGRKK